MAYVDNVPTLNEVFMIDDFESYRLHNGTYSTPTWLFSVGLPSAAVKTYSAPQDLEDYSHLSMWAYGDEGDTMEVWFRDNDNNNSDIIYITLSEDWTRYEFSVSEGSCDMSQIRTIHFANTSADGIVGVDDLLMFAMKSEREKRDWMTLRLVGYDLTRQPKVGTLPIPGNRNSIVQHFGENSGRGSLNLRTNNKDELSFFSNKANKGVPLLLRYKSEALPIIISKINPTYTHYVAGSYQTRLDIVYVEIFDMTQV